MTTPYSVLAALAQERLQALYAEAAASRLARQSFAAEEGPRPVRPVAPQATRPVPLR